MATALSPQPETVQTPTTRFHTLTGVQVLATGAALPKTVVRNEDLISLGCDAEWIVQRTGIRERRHAPAEMATSDLACEAATACLTRAGATADELDLILVATVTPDQPMPSTACLLQRRLGCTAAAMDVNAACSGFVYALATAAQFIATGHSQRALVVGADLMSRTVNPQDKKTYPLFGDGAGAVLLGPGDLQQGLLAYTMGADGRGAELLCLPAGGTREPATPQSLAAGRQFVRMEGRAVFRWAVRTVADSIREAVRFAHLDLDDVDLLVLHQANARIIDAIVTELGVDRANCFVNLDRYGNTSAASIPIALAEAVQQDRVRRGDRVVLAGFGAGLTWGTAVLQW